MDFQRNSKMFECGRHSGFPLCCILWYIYIWTPLYVSWELSHYRYSFTRLYHFLMDKIGRWRKVTHTYTEEDGAVVENETGYGRIPCPLCLFIGIKNYFKVYPCDCMFHKEE